MVWRICSVSHAFFRSQACILKGYLWLIASLGVLASTACDSIALGGTISYIAPVNAPNSNANWPGGTSFSNNYGIAFTTGSSGPFDIDWIDLGLNTSSVASGSASLTIALRNATNDTAYSAVAGTTEFARDTVSFSMPTATSTGFALNLGSAQLPNISAYSLASNTSYALILYAPTVSIGMGRTTGFANGTTNNFYTVSNGFTMLDTFRNNLPNYSNNATSFPTLAISFGANSTSAVPEPSTVILGSLVTGAMGFVSRRRKLKERRVKIKRCHP